VPVGNVAAPQRAALVRTFCHACGNDQDHDLSELPAGTYATEGTVVQWWCLGCGYKLDAHESWGVTLDGLAPYAQASA
jgi:hypothetical protein